MKNMKIIKIIKLIKMKYFILSKQECEGIPGNDSGDLNKYFELGWEIVGSRLDLIYLINTSQIDLETTCFVTHKDRMCLYPFCKHIVSYDEFKTIKNPSIIRDIPANYKTLRFLKGNEFITSELKYCRLSEDYGMIFNGFDLNKTLSIKRNYIVICIRFRSWCKVRDSDIKHFENLINTLIKDFDIYIVGKGLSYLQRDNVYYVDNLRDYVTLLKNVDNKGKAVISQSTGTLLLAMSASTLPIFVIDTNNVCRPSERNAVLGSEGINFTPFKIKKYSSNYMEILKEIYN